MEVTGKSDHAITTLFVFLTQLGCPTVLPSCGFGRVQVPPPEHLRDRVLQTRLLDDSLKDILTASAMSA